MTDGLDAFLNSCRDRTNLLLTNYLPPSGPDPLLVEAVRYTVLSDGKRIRPCLVYAGATATGVDTSCYPEATDKAAGAVELIHNYSLIHDDLPAMDDDDLRRGKPTCHIAYGEATAILAGDALQAQAYALLSLIQDIPASQVVLLIKQLAQASGMNGMVLGQAMDIHATNKTVDINYLETMHHHKTADLIAASVVMGALSAGTTDQKVLQALHEYGMAIGLAFQVKDDILDEISDINTLGKSVGADAKLNKTTYTSLLGNDRSQSMLNGLLQQSLQALDSFDDQADLLRNIAHYIINRNF